MNPKEITDNIGTLSGLTVSLVILSIAIKTFVTELKNINQQSK